MDILRFLRCVLKWILWLQCEPVADLFAFTLTSVFNMGVTIRESPVLFCIRLFLMHTPPLTVASRFLRYAKR